MKQYLFPILLAGSMLGACSSTKALKPSKDLPANWQNEDILNSTVYSNGASRGEYRADIRPASHMTSLWSSSPKSLFGDRRASQLGDIVTVVIELDEEAELENSVNTNRNNTNKFNVNAFFGLPEVAAKNLPTGASLSPAVDISKSRNLSGTGKVKRKEKLTLRLAARVNAVLPNGYLGLVGRQEIMVNSEVRQLQVTGLVRVQDISRLNIITYDKIAEARIFYGGQGQITNTVQPKIGNKILDKLIPF